MAITIKENIPLNKHTTLKTGGVASYFVEVTVEEDVEEAAHFAQQNELPILVIGGGSNLLISDKGFAGLVILNSLKGREYTPEADGTILLRAQSGEVFDEVVAETVDLGYWGLENLSAIPGTIGATPVQNVGAYGSEVAEVIFEIETYNLISKTKKIFTKDECEFNYRESFFKTELGKNYFITTVVIKLKKEISPKLSYTDLKKQFGERVPSQLEIRKAVMEIRSKKFPDWKVLGTAGSFFKNPIISRREADTLLLQYPDLPQYEAGPELVKIPLGYVLDRLCGLKGYRLNNVGLFAEQALVLVNYGGATTNEIKNFARIISDKVFLKTKLIVSPEVRYIENK